MAQTQLPLFPEEATLIRDIRKIEHIDKKPEESLLNSSGFFLQQALIFSIILICIQNPWFMDIRFPSNQVPFDHFRLMQLTEMVFPEPVA